MKKLIIAAMFAALAVPAYAKSDDAASDASTANFVKQAAMTDMFEIKAGELAQEKSQSSEVKQFGKQMVQDHQKTSGELKKAVQSEKVDAKIPDSLDDKHQQKLEQLKSASGEKFDGMYRKMQMKAHQKAVKLFTTYSESGDNETLKKWAGSTLPTLKEHLKHAKSLSEGSSKGT